MEAQQSVCLLTPVSAITRIQVELILRWYSNMAYLPQYNDSRHSSTADDASIAAAFQQELDAENRQYSKPKENTLRDSDVARKFQQEENSKAEGSFKVL